MTCTVAIIMYADAIKFFKECMAYEWISKYKTSCFTKLRPNNYPEFIFGYVKLNNQCKITHLTQN